jgi:parvulin-like peptidyl-prolyl isomerase
MPSVMKAMACAWWGLVLLLQLNVAAADALFATVGDEQISYAEYEAHVAAGLRQQFYHGKVPEAQLQAFREKMGNELIDRALLVQEARRRGLQARKARIDDEVAQTRQRYQDRPGWQQQEQAVLAQLRAKLARQDLIAQLRKQVVDAVAMPDEEAARQYYQRYPEKFTTPERLRLSLIMLGVEPWSPTVKWQAAEEEAKGLVQRLRAGTADFADLARLRSSDASASQGGDLGYVHVGMLAPDVQQHVEKLHVGDVAEPLRLLQGIAIFRLDGRQDAQLNAFEQVQERAAGLLQRRQQQQAWTQLLERLREQTPIKRYQKTVSDEG